MMAWLVARDVWPAWRADDPPRVRPGDWIEEADRHAQFTVADEFGPIGTIWTRAVVDRDSLQRYDTILLDELRMSGGVPLAAIGPLKLTVDSTFSAEGLLDEFTATVESPIVEKMRLHGERFYADFSFTFSAGSEAREQAFKMPLVDGGLIGGALSPFASLSGLRVGRSWRMQVFNPIAALTGAGDRFLPVLMTVTGREALPVGNGRRNCYVIESPNTKVWVDERGSVLRQETALPLVGRILITREDTYDEDAHAAARRLRLYRTEKRQP